MRERLLCLELGVNCGLQWPSVTGQEFVHRPVCPVGTKTLWHKGPWAAAHRCSALAAATGGMSSCTCFLSCETWHAMAPCSVIQRALCKYDVPLTAFGAPCAHPMATQVHTWPLASTGGSTCPLATGRLAQLENTEPHVHFVSTTWCDGPSALGLLRSAGPACCIALPRQRLRTGIPYIMIPHVRACQWACNRSCCIRQHAPCISYCS